MMRPAVEVIIVIVYVSGMTSLGSDYIGKDAEQRYDRSVQQLVSSSLLSTCPAYFTVVVFLSVQILFLFQLIDHPA